MLYLTPEAAALVAAIRYRKGHDDGAVLRITADGVGLRRGVRLGFVEHPEDGDLVAEAHGLTYCVADETAQRLHGVTMDVRLRDGRRRFVLDPRD